MLLRRIIGGLAAITLASSLAVLPARAQQSAPAGIAQSSVGHGAASATSAAEGGIGVRVGQDTVDLARWWGALGAAICGIGIRVAQIPVVGPNPWVVAPTIGGCLLAVMDIAVR